MKTSSINFAYMVYSGFVICCEIRWDKNQCYVHHIGGGEEYGLEMIYGLF